VSLAFQKYITTQTNSQTLCRKVGLLPQYSVCSTWFSGNQELCALRSKLPKLPNDRTIQTALRFKLPKLLNDPSCPNCGLRAGHESSISFTAPQLNQYVFVSLERHVVNLNLNYTHHFTNVEVTGLLSGSTRFGNVDYKAAAMIHHVGPSFTSGHYFCSLPTEDGQWWTIDDLQQNPLRLSASRLQLTVCCVLFERMTQPELHSQERAPSPEF
jgi:hypothetical protein